MIILTPVPTISDNSTPASTSLACKVCHNQQNLLAGPAKSSEFIGRSCKINRIYWQVLQNHQDLLAGLAKSTEFMGRT